jgi:hypothetical protein
VARCCGCASRGRAVATSGRSWLPPLKHLALPPLTVVPLSVLLLVFILEGIVSVRGARLRAIIIGSAAWQWRLVHTASIEAAADMGAGGRGSLE